MSILKMFAFIKSKHTLFYVHKLTNNITADQVFIFFPNSFVRYFNMPLQRTYSLGRKGNFTTNNKKINNSKEINYFFYFYHWKNNHRYEHGSHINPFSTYLFSAPEILPL